MRDNDDNMALLPNSDLGEMRQQAPSLPTTVISGDISSDADQPCPDPRCNDLLGAIPIPQCVAAVAWAERSQDSVEVLRELSNRFGAIDAGTCKLCTGGFRLYDTKGNPQPCDNKDCFSYRIAAVLDGKPSTSDVLKNPDRGTRARNETESSESKSTLVTVDEAELTLETVLWAAANFISCAPDHRPPEQREVVLKGLRWAMERYAASPTPDVQAADMIAKAFPTSWLDPLLSGPDAVLGKGPWGCPDIERLLTAIKERVLASFTASPVLVSTYGKNFGRYSTDEEATAIDGDDD